MKKTDSLYKYTRLEYVNSSINNGIYASRIDCLNDPYECKDIPNPSKYRIVCLSRSRNQKLMWSHYANGHRGCSIKIVVPNDYDTENCPLRRVTYTGKYVLKENLSEAETVEALYAKDKKWDKELEVRAVYDGTQQYDVWKKYRNNIYFKATITQIDFGCFSQHDIHYLDALIAIRDYNTNHSNKIKVRKYKMSDTRYEFIIDNEFNYLDEIAKLTGEKDS